MLDHIFNWKWRFNVFFKWKLICVFRFFIFLDFDGIQVLVNWIFLHFDLDINKLNIFLLLFLRLKISIWLETHILILSIVHSFTVLFVITLRMNLLYLNLEAFLALQILHVGVTFLIVNLNAILINAILINGLIILCHIIISIKCHNTFIHVHFSKADV